MVPDKVAAFIDEREAERDLLNRLTLASAKAVAQEHPPRKIREPTFSEQDRRREGFMEGEPVVLCDGQTWHFARPALRWVPALKDSAWVFGRDRYVPGTNLSIQQHINTIIEPNLEEDEDYGKRQMQASLSMAVGMLTANYDLSPDEIATLLVYNQEDEESQAMWNEIVNCALGIVPKPSPVGSSAASQPTA